MHYTRWAAAPAILMSLMNIGVGPSAAEEKIPIGIAWAISAFGVVGLIAAGALIRRAPWGRRAVLAYGVMNAVASIVMMTQHRDGSAIGLVVSAAIIGVSFVPARVRTVSATTGV
jgi:hypothetical protein